MYNTKGYKYKSITRLKYGERFQFAGGATINLVVHKERNLLIYMNLLTGKIRRVKGFVDVNKETQTCAVRYCKMLDGLFDKFIQQYIDTLNAPF